jgi:hypothetical protein
MEKPKNSMLQFVEGLSGLDYHQEVVAIIKQLNLKSVAELGVFHCALSRKILDNCDINSLILVDCHMTPEAQKIKNAKKVTFHNTTTTQAASFVANNSLDMVIVDADHRYKGAKEDILRWYPKVKKGGVICGHDYGNWRGGFRRWEVWDVKRAVNELFPRAVITKNNYFWVDIKTD